LTQNRRSAETLGTRGLDVHAEALDMGQEESIRQFCSNMRNRFGGVDVLVNNAVLRTMKDFWSSTASQWEDSVRVNVTGIHLCTQLIADQMLQREAGNIINISSIYGIVGPTFPIYEGTKMMCAPDYAFHRGGIISYTRYLATLLAPRVRVNCLSLGGLRSNDEDERFVEQYSKRCPLGRKAEADDVKGPIIFLASDASRYMTGHNLVVDGGWTAW
jgi:NAD(P)-dependent dehydrogenase (short-subunit alcohol dehydrogenase family)